MKVAQSCPTLCGFMDGSPPGSSVHGFLRQEYWSGQPLPFPGDLPNPGIESRSPALQVHSLPSEPPGKPPNWCYFLFKYLEENTSEVNCAQRLPRVNVGNYSLNLLNTELFRFQKFSSCFHLSKSWFPRKILISTTYENLLK